MATADAQNRVYLFRLQVLIIDGGLLVLRNLLDHKLHVQNITLSTCLTQENPTISRLRRNDTITQVQYDLLYPPPGGQPPTIADFDITLIICLLRNLKCCGLKRNFNWNAIPNATDQSVEADIYRLKLYRNQISHISTTTGIKLKDFRFKWTDIEQILLRLNISVPNLQQTIDDIKKSPLDPEAEERIQKAVDEWKKLEKAVEVDLRQVKEDIKFQEGKVKEIYNRIELNSGEQNKVADLEADIKQVKEDAQSMKDESKIQDEKMTELVRITQNKVADLEKQLDKSKHSTEKHTEQKDLNTQDSIATNLKEDLIALYRKQYYTLPLSPLIEKHDAPLLKFYVMPEINSVEIQRSFGGGNQIKSEITSLHDVFYKKGTMCREIYLTADAGLGKTAFSKRLVLTWCQSQKRIESDHSFFKEGDVQAMSEFEFVFFLSLRGCTEECDIDKMIVNQIIPRLAHTSVTVMNIENILFNENCLVILDGLDEWTHPDNACKLESSDIPHRKARECTILTTTRPWKLSVISLSSSQIQQKLELVGLNEESAYELKKSVISLLCNNAPNLDEYIDRFDSIVKAKGISELESTPLQLMYLLCLWCDGIDLGRSKCELYCQIVEMLLRRTFKKHSVMQQAREPTNTDFPQCFREHEHCKKTYPLLKALGELAFETLFSEKRENSLVFQRSTAEKCLNIDEDTDHLKFFLDAGILRQNKEQKLTSRSSKVSFSHKTVHEYFCALYISCQNENDVQKLVQRKFHSVQNILDMSQVFVFISGLNSEIMSSVSRELMSVINSDQITIKYRYLTGYDYKYSDPLKDIQNMLISCLKENTDNASLCFQDLFIDKDYEKEKHLLDLKWLSTHNRINIQSVLIRTGVQNVREIIDQYGLDNLCSLRKIYYRGECEVSEIIRLLTNKSLECVTVVSSTWQGYGFISKISSFSDKLSKTIQNMSQLRAISINSFEMEHDVLENFIEYITKRKSMTEIELFNIFCVKHRHSCRELKLNFSRHSGLRSLGLCNIPVTQLKVNVSSLEDCTVGRLSKPGLVTSFLRDLQTASKLQSFQCSSLTFPVDIETMLETLPSLVQVKVVRLDHINLGERSQTLTRKMGNVEYVELHDVTMSCSTLHNLVKVLEELQQSVTVKMWGCNITPETKFTEVKRYLETSENFMVTFDDINQFDRYAFEFQTAKLEAKYNN